MRVYEAIDRIQSCIILFCPLASFSASSFEIVGRGTDAGGKSGSRQAEQRRP